MLILFLSLIVLILIGMPIAFSIGIASLLFIIFETNTSVDIILQKLISGVDSFPLLALPLFIFAGNLMAKGSTSRLTRLADNIVGFLTGGMGIAAVFASAFFGAVSGSGVATTAAVGSVMGPEMTKRNYPKGFSASLFASVGGLGMLIPPSVLMVIYGISSGTSIGALLIAGIIPGLIITVLMAITVIIITKAMKFNVVSTSFNYKELIISFKEAILPLLTPLIIIGGIIGGVFTPTEAAGVAVIYAFILGFFIYKELKLSEIPGLLKSTVLVSTTILFIMSASEAFSWIITIENIPGKIADFMLATIASPIMILLIIQLIILILGTFVIDTAIIIITTPIFLPVAMSFGMDPIVYGVVLAINLIIAGATPPLAVGLFTAANIMKIEIDETFKYLWMFLVTLFVALVLHLFVPALSTWLPDLMQR